MLAVGAASKIFMQGLTTTAIVGGDILRNALRRTEGQALITVSNHVASLDDPLVVAPMVPLWEIMKSEKLRYS